MEDRKRQYGFSLTETLMAVGTLAVGLLFIGGTFMTSVYLTTVSTERTIAAVAADEAFAKIRLYELDPNAAGMKTDAFTPYEQIKTIPATESLYPSTGDTSASRYSWAALCKRAGTDSRLVQVIVFVCRESSAAAKYWVHTAGTDPPQLEESDTPRPVRVTIMQAAAVQNTDEVSIVDANSTDTIDTRMFINDGTSIVDGATGQIYRVLKRFADQPDKVKLDRPWTGGAIASPGGGVWVVPPPISGGRDPLVAIYEATLRF